MDPRQNQAQNHQSGYHHNPYLHHPQQSGQYPQPPPNTYNDRAPSHHDPQSGQGYGGHSPYAGTVSFPEVHHGGSSGHQQAYIPPAQTMQNLTVPKPQHGRRGSHGHSPTESYSAGLYPAGAGSDTGSGSNFYPPQPGFQPHHGGGYTATATQPQDLNPAGHEGAQGHDPWSLAPGNLPVGGHRQLQSKGGNAANAAAYEGHGSRPKGPESRPSATGQRPLCRYPGCRHHVFLDRRVDEYREWCNDAHMQAAIRNRVEKPCNVCRVWPRINGHKFCSGNVCRYPGQYY